MDLGRYQIRVIDLNEKKRGEWEYVSGGYKFHRLNIESEREVEVKEFKDLMSKLWKELGIKSNHVHTALSEDVVYTRVLRLPVLSDNELNNALKFELEQYIPLPVEKVYYSFVRLEKVKEKKGFKELVFVAAVPRERVDKFLRVTTELGLVVEVLETSMTALARSVSLQKENPVLIVDLGYSQFSLGIAKKGRLYISQKLELSGAALTRLLARTLNVDEVQAEQIKNRYGLDRKQLNGKVADILSVAVNQLADEAKRTIAFFEDKVLAEKVKEVVLTGGGAVLPDLAGYLSGKLEMEVGLPLFGDTVIKGLPNEIKSKPHIYAQAIGSAIRHED